MTRTVDTIYGVATTKKGGKTTKAVRKVELTADTIDAIKRLITPEMTPESHIFPAPNGEPWKRGNFLKAWERATRAAGVRHLGFHSTRHTSATILISAGVPVNLVAERLGHSDTNETLRTYTHLFDTDLHRCAQVLDDLFRKPRDKPNNRIYSEFIRVSLDT